MNNTSKIIKYARKISETLLSETSYQQGILILILLELFILTYTKKRTMCVKKQFPIQFTIT
jgi:hypothetical protein